MVDQSTYRQVKGWDQDQFGLFTSDEAAYFSAELTGGGVDTSHPLSVLEFGFGNGAFAMWCHRRGWRWTGVEADAELVRRAVAAGLSASAAPPQNASAPLDLIVGFDVFEHMSLGELKSVLDFCRGALREGGRLIGRVPSGDSPFSGWIYNGDTTHKLLLGSSAIRQLAAEAGLSVVCLKEPSVPMRGLGVRKAARRAIVRMLKAPIVVMVRVLFHGGQRTIITSNLVFVLQRAAQSQEIAIQRQR